MIFQYEKSPFQAIKPTSSKSQKINIFPKGLVHGFGPKLAIFLPFFPAIQTRKMCFMIFQKEKTPFQAIKTSLKSRKMDIFPNGLVHSLGPKVAIFPPSFFRQYIVQDNVFFMIFYNEKTPFQAIKTTSFKKSKNKNFF